MAQMVIKNVGVLSVAKVQGLVMAGIGLIFGIIYGLIFILFGAAMMAANGSGRGGVIGAGGSVIAGIIFMIAIPIFYGILGFVIGAITGLVYNVASKYVGGIELEMEPTPNSYDQSSTYNAPYNEPPPSSSPFQ